MGFAAKCPIPTCDFQATADTVETLMTNLTEHHNAIHTSNTLEVSRIMIWPRELPQSRVCEKCGELMLESDYDYYCMRDDLLIKKQNASPIPQFLDNESVIMLLEPGWSGRFKIADAPRWPEPGDSFTDAVLTNQRLIFLNHHGTVLTIELSSIRAARVQGMKSIVDRSMLIISTKQNASISVVLSNQRGMVEGLGEARMEGEWVEAINEQAYPLRAAAAGALESSELLAKSSEGSWYH